MTRIEQIEARLKKITPGPWLLEPRLSTRVRDYANTTIASAGMASRSTEDAQANAAFIAAAPDNITYLLAQLKEAEQQRDKARELLQRLRIVDHRGIGRPCSGCLLEIEVDKFLSSPAADTKKAVNFGIMWSLLPLRNVPKPLSLNLRMGCRTGMKNANVISKIWGTLQRTCTTAN